MRKMREYSESELDTVKGWVKEWEVDLTDTRLDLNILANQFYEDELNYNNADTTSGQTCFLDVEILEILHHLTYLYEA